MHGPFLFDVFLSHSSTDKVVVRDIAERLAADGLKVWFDEWVIKPGDSIPTKIEEGLEQSRVLVLCMSANAFGSEWSQLESQTFRFRDPLNKQRHFLPLRLDDADIKGSLAQFLYIKWFPTIRDQEYHKLLKACRNDLGAIEIQGQSEDRRSFTRPENVKAIAEPQQPVIAKSLNEVTTYIARADEDSECAMTLAKLLQPHGVGVSDRSTLCGGEKIDAAIKSQIRSCDHMLVLRSAAAATAPTVACDVGLAIKLQGERNRLRPMIVPITVGNPRECSAIQPLDFDSKEPIGDAYSFVDRHSFDLRCKSLSEEVHKLAKQLKPAVTFITEVDGDEGRLFWESVKVYEALFPEEERDSPENIAQWIRDGRFAQLKALPYREIYAVLHKGETPIGIAYLTAYLDYHWAFGNYLGVLSCHRHDRTTERFLHAIRAHLQELDPQTKGFVFEVEPINWDCLARATDRGEISGSDEEEKIKTSLRRLRRLNLYQQSNCRALLRANHSPLLLKTPALDGSMDRAREGEFIVMLHQLGTPRINLSDLLDFLYDGLYGDAFCTGTVKYEGYDRYLANLRRKVERAARPSWQLGEITPDRLIVSKGTKPSRGIRSLIIRLLKIAHREGLDEEIGL